MRPFLISFCPNESLSCERGGFLRIALLDPWKEVYYALMCYITLQGTFQVFYYYYFHILNHFRNRDLILFLYLILHPIEGNILNVKKKIKEGKPYTILHQAFMFKLYNFHKALCPLEPINVQVIFPNLAISTLTPQEFLEIASKVETKFPKSTRP